MNERFLGASRDSAVSAILGAMKEVPLPNNGTAEKEGKRPAPETTDNKATLYQSAISQTTGHCTPRNGLQAAERQT